MYSKLSKVLFPILAVCLLSVCFWGYTIYQDNKHYANQVENQYQRAFHDLASNMENVHHELGQTMVLNPNQQASYRKGLGQVWRHADMAKSNLSHLPLGLMPVADTEHFLANLANMTHQISMREAHNQPLQASEISTLQNLYAHAKDLSQQLRLVQQQVLQNQLRWSEVEKGLAKQEGPKTLAIVDGFSSMNNHVKDKVDVDWGSHLIENSRAIDTRNLKGNDVQPAEVKQKALHFLGMTDVQKLQVSENGHDSRGYTSYDIQVEKRRPEEPEIQLNFTKKGGELMYFFRYRDVKEIKLNARQARDKGNEFLDRHGYTEMSAVQFNRNQATATIVYAKKQEKVLIYPQQVVLQVALDNGEIVAMDASPYVLARKDRKIEPMKLNLAEAQQQLNRDFQVKHTAHVMILNDAKQEVACYEFWGRLADHEYRVLINGQTGIAEKVEPIQARDR